MRTMHSILKHGGLYWDRALTTPEACEQRFKRVQQAVAQSGDDAWLVFGDIQRHGNLVFVSNFLPRVRSALVCVPREGAPTLLANIGLRDVPAAKTITWVDDVRAFGRLPKEVIGLIEQQGLKAGRIGTCGFDQSLPVTEWEAIEKGLPGVHWTARDETMAQLRASKADWEIAAMRRASDMAVSALALAPKLLRPGAELRKVIAAIDLAARRQGAEDTRYLIGFGGGALRPVDDRILAAGDVLTLYMTIEAQRYWAEAARTIVLGTADGKLRALFDQGAKAMAAMAAVTRAGSAVADVANAAKSALGDTALYRGAQTYGLGNGIGLDSDESPIIDETITGALVENAAVTTRIVVQKDGVGIGLSQTLVARAHGSEPITVPASLIEIQS
jgi:Xaa-Pro aminopeptidase